MDIKTIQLALDANFNKFKDLTVKEIQDKINGSTNAAVRVASGEHAAHLAKHCHNDKVRAATSKRMREQKQKSICSPFGVFASRKDMHNTLSKRFEHTDFHRRPTQLPHLYYYIEDGPGKPTQEKIFNTVYGKAPNILWHWEQAIKAGCIEAAKVKDPQEKCCEWFNKMKKRDPEHWYKTNEDAVEWLELGIKKFPNRKKG